MIVFRQKVKQISFPLARGVEGKVAQMRECGTTHMHVMNIFRPAERSCGWYLSNVMHAYLLVCMLLVNFLRLYIVRHHSH